jgi:hypothetical protein
MEPEMVRSKTVINILTNKMTQVYMSLKHLNGNKCSSANEKQIIGTKLKCFNRIH